MHFDKMVNKVVRMQHKGTKCTFSLIKQVFIILNQKILYPDYLF